VHNLYDESLYADLNVKMQVDTLTLFQCLLSILHDEGVGVSGGIALRILSVTIRNRYVTVRAEDRLGCLRAGC
jgi:hypothetical protein